MRMGTAHCTDARGPNQDRNPPQMATNAHRIPGGSAGRYWVGSQGLSGSNRNAPSRRRTVRPIGTMPTPVLWQRAVISSFPETAYNRGFRLVDRFSAHTQAQVDEQRPCASACNGLVRMALSSRLWVSCQWDPG